MSLKTNEITDGEKFFLAQIKRLTSIKNKIENKPAQQRSKQELLFLNNVDNTLNEYKRECSGAFC